MSEQQPTTSVLATTSQLPDEVHHIQQHPLTMVPVSAPSSSLPAKSPQPPPNVTQTFQQRPSTTAAASAAMTEYSSAKLPEVVYTFCFKAIEIIGKDVAVSSGANKAFTNADMAIKAAEQMWLQMGAPVYGDDVKRDSSDEVIDKTVHRLTGGKSLRAKGEQLVIWVEALTVEYSTVHQSQPVSGPEGTNGVASPEVAVEDQSSSPQNNDTKAD